MHVIPLPIHSPILPAPEQLCGRIELLELARVQHQDAVAVHDGVQPVRDGEHGAVAERGADGALDERVGCIVHVGGGLVQHQDLQAWECDGGGSKPYLRMRAHG
jgi:hypothetical protein